MEPMQPNNNSLPTHMRQIKNARTKRQNKKKNQRNTIQRRHKPLNNRNGKTYRRKMQPQNNPLKNNKQNKN